MRDTYGYDRRSGGSFAVPAIIAVVILAIVVAGWWFVFGYWFDITARQWKWLTQIVIERGFMPAGLNVLHWTDNAYLFTGIFVAIGAFFLYNTQRVLSYVAMVIAGLLVLISVLTWSHDINNHSAAYAGSTTFVVKDTETMPDSLKLLADVANEGQSNDCKLLADRDMPGCIAEGSFDYTWEARTASAVGATKRIKRSSTGNNRTQLLDDTLSYTYGKAGEGSWTAIRDGKSKEPVYGVLSYDGKSDPTICKFDGENELNKAFGGTWGTNLSDEIADKYPNLFYDESDRWGYCDGTKPVIVIPVKEQVPFRHRTAFRAGGVLVITGSPSGDARYQHIQDVKPGDFPGPVYSASLAKEQRESMGMIAGIKNSWFKSFGYEPVDEESQDGNTSEYLLRNKNDGRVYWVTPMKQRGGDNQRIVAYSVIPADSTSDGSLNRLQVYVLNDDDSRVASISDMETSVRQKLSESYAGFYTAKGYLAEFLPLDDKTWQVYAEINGRVVYRIVVPVDTDIEPTIFKVGSIEQGPSSESGTNTKSACSDDLTKLSEKQLTLCIGDAAKELNSRQE